MGFSIIVVLTIITGKTLDKLINETRRKTINLEDDEKKKLERFFKMMEEGLKSNME